MANVRFTMAVGLPSISKVLGLIPCTAQREEASASHRNAFLPYNSCLVITTINHSGRRDPRLDSKTNQTLTLIPCRSGLASQPSHFPSPHLRGEHIGPLRIERPQIQSLGLSLKAFSLQTSHSF